MILVIGGTGTTGTEVLRELSRRGVKTRALVRKRSEKIELPGVEQMMGDLSRPETIAPALGGVESAFLLTSPSRDAGVLQGNFIAAAQKAKLGRLVKLSAYGAAPDSPCRLLRQHAEIEKQIAEVGVPFTFLRPAQFMQAFTNYKDLIALQGAFYAPLGDARVNLVDVRDIAAVAARALTEPAHAGKAYDITGPEAITYHRAAQALSQSLNRQVRYVDIPSAVFRENLSKIGLSDWMADGVLELYEVWRNNGATEVTDVVEKVGGKKPTTIEQFAADYAPFFLGRSAAGG